MDRNGSRNCWKASDHRKSGRPSALDGGEAVKKSLIIALILAWMLVGCEKEEKPVVTDEKKSPDVLIQNENKTLHQQVDQLQAQLQGIEQKYKDLQEAVETSKAEQQPLTTKYPKLADFSSPQEFQKIQIIDAKGSKTITNPVMLKSISNFIVIKNEASLGSGPQADIEPVQYILATAKGTVKVNVEQQGIVSFPDTYLGHYFEVDNTVYQLGKAFMNRPSYLNEEPAIVRMVNSGILKVVEKNSTDVYMSLSGRIHSIAMAFITADKREIIKPKDISAVILNMVFYYFGEEIQMNLYKGNVQIKDGNGEKWFEMNEEDIGQIRARISAS
jgi:hypothetical protein